MIIYGIKNCNTVKSAIDYLKRKKIDFEFHDYKTVGVTEEKLKSWSKQVGWEKLLNTKGMTWRQLDENTRKKINNESAAIGLMKNKTSIIKRPVLEKDGQIITLGFDQTNYDKIFSR
jgi:arsenate reductase (glutaredoxin)